MFPSKVRSSILPMMALTFSTDIHKGAIKGILPLLWRLIVNSCKGTLQVFDGTQVVLFFFCVHSHLVENNAKGIVLDWVRESVQPFGIDFQGINDLRDGTILCAIISKHQPGALAFEGINK